MTASGSPPPGAGPGRPRLPHIIPHLGAQRTGSTRLQSILDANRGALLVSVYAMSAVYRRDVPPFDDLRETFLAVHRGWPDVVDDVARAGGP